MANPIIVVNRRAVDEPELIGAQAQVVWGVITPPCGLRLRFDGPAVVSEEGLSVVLVLPSTPCLHLLPAVTWEVQRRALEADGRITGWHPPVRQAQRRIGRRCLLHHHQ